jgi:hypothetical protein
MPQVKYSVSQASFSSKAHLARRAVLSYSSEHGNIHLVSTQTYSNITVGTQPILKTFPLLVITVIYSLKLSFDGSLWKE